MKERIAFIGAVICASAVMASPAYAGMPVPGPEDGLGLGALALVGAGYAYLKRRLGRR